MYMRTIDCGGKIRMSFTPVKGLTWAYNDLYKKAYKLVSTINIHGIPEEAGLVHTPEELELMRDRQLVVKYNNDPDADHNIEFYTGAMYDNPFLPLAEIHNAELECKNDIGAYNARVLGRFTQLSGNKVFYIPTLLKMQSGLSSTYPRYSIFGDRLERDVRGHFTIFKDKKEGEHYVIGADVAQGLEQGDNSCVQVLSRSGCEQIACWCGKISPEKFADLLNYLGCYYNHAKMAPEINFHGFGVVNRLREVHKYPQLYYHYNLKEEVLKGKSSVSQVKAYGWLTTEASKAMMIQDLSAYIRDGHIKLHDWHTVDELITYIYDPNGKMTAMGGCLDDRVIALGIALQLFKKTSPAITQTTLHPYKPRVSERMGY
jgi:hypothetical protein